MVWLYSRMSITEVKREKNFTVYWISFKCRENFCRSCIERANLKAITQDSLEKFLRFIESLRKPQNFSHLTFVVYGILR